MTPTQHTDEPSVDDVYRKDVPAEMLNSPVFEAIWSVVKHWDVGVPAAYGGYCAGNGSHVAAIVNALARLSHPTLSADQIARIIVPHSSGYTEEYRNALAKAHAILAALKQ